VLAALFYLVLWKSLLASDAYDYNLPRISAYESHCCARYIIVAVFDLMPKAKRWFGIRPILVWESLGHSLACLMCIGDDVTVGQIYFADVVKWCVATSYLHIVSFPSTCLLLLGFPTSPTAPAFLQTGARWQSVIQSKKAIGTPGFCRY
jgi:hypothetical protein